MEVSVELHTPTAFSPVRDCLAFESDGEERDLCPCRGSKPRHAAHGLVITVTASATKRLAYFICSRTDLDKLAVELTVTLPHIDATLDYDVDGRILVANFKGKGVFKGNFSK
jgi:hypothetical protein